MLVAPGGEASAEKKRFPTVDTGLQTNIAGDEQAPSAPGKARADTLAEDDEHLLPTVAEESGPSAALLAAASNKTPPPDTEEVSALDVAEVTATETASKPAFMPKVAGDTAAALDDGSGDEEIEVTEASVDLAKISAGDNTSAEDEKAASPAGCAPSTRAESPDVLTRTIAEEHVAAQQARAPAAAGLPPLPSPRTPKPSAPPPAFMKGAPLPSKSSALPPRPNSTSKAPPIPGSVAKAASRSGVMSSAPHQPDLMSSAAPPAPASAASTGSRSGVVSSAPPLPKSAAAARPAPASAASTGTRSGVVSSAPPLPKSAAAAAAPSQASNRPSDVLPRPPNTGRPSDVLPRAPASSVVRPGPGSAATSQAMPMLQGNPPLSAVHNQLPHSIAGSPVPPGMVSSPVPPGMVSSPVPPGMVSSPVPPGMVANQPPHMMQSFPTPSNMARPPAPGRMQSPAPHAADPSMVAMPSAYALPGSGYGGGAPPMTPAPQGPLVHTPIPPGLIGPPPDLNEGAGLGAALNSLDQETRSPREDTPSANAVWRDAHPSAQKWAAKRHGGAVRTPKPGIIALGLLLAGFGAYLLAIFLPTKQPLDAAMKEQLAHQAGVDEHAWHFSDTLIDAANINAALFVLLGVVIVLRGALFQQQAAGHARKGLSKPAVLLIFCFVLLAVSFGALVMSAST